MELLIEGYDHILDTEDEKKNIVQIAEEEGNHSTVEFLQSIQNFTVRRILYQLLDFFRHFKIINPLLNLVLQKRNLNAKF